MMNSDRSDASTSTDDIKGRPLCLFFFTHPFGVLSPEPPIITTAPENITQAFINMEPVSPYNIWSSTQDSYNTTPTSSNVSYNLGNVMIPKKPISLVTVPKYTVDFNLRKESIPSSWLSSDIWYSSSSSDLTRRVMPYNRTLPPLEMPTPNLTGSSEDFWTRKSYTQSKFSLPPIDMPKKCKKQRRKVSDNVTSDESELMKDVRDAKRSVRVVGVRKVKTRVRMSGIRRMVTGLMQRAIKGRKDHNSSPAIQEVLNTIREAWAEPKSLLERCRAPNQTSDTRDSVKEESTEEDTKTAMLKRPQLAELSPRADASPGLLRRRYSVPETIMRKYCLAQQKSDSEDTGATTAPSRDASPASPSPPKGSCASLCEPHNRFIRKDRELMRKSALMRRLWTRPNCNPCPSCCYCNGDLYDSQGECGRETKSLDGSRSELRPLSSSFTSSRYSRESHTVAGWSSPKRQKLESPNKLHASDEMLRIAMKNSYERAEETRIERESPQILSDSTYTSNDYRDSLYAATTSDTNFTDSTKSNNFQDNTSDEQYSEGKVEENSFTCNLSTANVQSDESSLTDTNSTISRSTLTAKESKEVNLADQHLVSKQEYIHLHVNQESENIENNDNNLHNYERSLKETSPSYEVLEIIVSETLDSSAFDQDRSANRLESINKELSNNNEIIEQTNMSIQNQKTFKNINIDEYVSHILVESLNSLTDQLESMNASMGNDRKISIVEKEIKVKLQNTGVNTIVHLSPTSNNQIIFGNEELYNKENDKDIHSSIQHLVPEREETNSVESNNNLTASPDTCRESKNADYTDFYLNKQSAIPHDTVNRAVLKHIQKLFQDELQNVDNDTNIMPGIAHIEISNVDVFIANNNESNRGDSDTISIETNNNINNFNEHSLEEHERDMLNGVGSGNYYESTDENVVVPRFSAFPISDSMEVNTSSSENANIVDSECTSLVDSLDDPNSPRPLFSRRHSKRSELVCSEIDVLDLLPEITPSNETHCKDKSESFFIRIKDNDCNCEKENIIVADHMPEIIKQRLYRRHRKRELRMECTRRKKVKQIKKEMDKQKLYDASKPKSEIKSDCISILNAMIDEVIAKITQEEYKYMRIKQKTNNHNKSSSRKSTDSSLSSHKRNTWKKNIDVLNEIDSYKHLRNETVSSIGNCNERERRNYRPLKEKREISGKMHFKAQNNAPTDDNGPRKIYQKSEIHDGNKCIEILEIFEYADNNLQSSPETSNSEENLTSSYRRKKSKIPIPIYETPNNQKSKYQKCYRSSPTLNYNNIEKSNRLVNSMLVNTMDNENLEDNIHSQEKENDATLYFSPRRASVPQHETRSRSNSLRFKQVFDIIPEEKSSLSVESPGDDISYTRRVSAPNLSNTCRADNKNTYSKSNENIQFTEDTKYPPLISSPKALQNTRCIGTSPFKEHSKENQNSSQRLRNKNIMTSPLTKSVATSPILPKAEKSFKSPESNLNSAKKSLSSHGTRSGWLGFYKPNKQILEQEGLKENLSSEKGSMKESKSVPIQCDAISQSTVRTIEGEKSEPIIIGKDKHLNQSEGRSKYDKQKDSKKKKLKQEFEIKSRQKVQRDGSVIRSQSDPQAKDVIIKKTDKKKIQMISLEKSEEETIHPNNVILPSAFKDINNADFSTSDSDNDSGKSLLCSLAPKWLSVGNMRNKRQVKKKSSQDHQNQANSAGGWSVTVAGNCYTALPADVEMRLSFPKTSTQQVNSQSDSGFGEDCRTRRPIAAPHPGCKCRHCYDCTCSSRIREEQDDRYPPILPPAQKMTVTMKKEASGSSILASKSTKKSSDPLPDVETYKASKSKTKSSVKMRRGCSLHCWLPGDMPQQNRMNNGLSVLGSAIIPEVKPRVPTMSERDLTRIYTPRHYLRS